MLKELMPRERKRRIGNRVCNKNQIKTLFLIEEVFDIIKQSIIERGNKVSTVLNYISNFIEKYLTVPKFMQATLLK